MSRLLSSWFRFVSMVLVIVGIAICSTSAQDISDIDMFGDTAQPDTPPADDPLNLDDFGGPDLGADVPPDGTQPQQKTYEEALQEGIALAERGQLAEAIRIFGNILNPQMGGNPNYAPASLELGKVHAELGEYELARQEFEQAAGTGAPFPGVVGEATVELGKVYMEQRLYTDAIESFELAVRNDPFDANALFLRGQAHIRSASSFGVGPGVGELIESAIESLDRAIELEEDNAEAYRERAQAHVYLRKFDKAVEDADKALSLDSESPETIARRAFTYLSRGANERNRYDADLEAAIADLQIALDAFNDYLAIEGDKVKEEFEDADPNLVRPDQVLASKAEVEITIGNELGDDRGFAHYQQAIEDANRLIEFDPDAAVAFYQRGVAQRILGDLRAAIESWDKALELSPRTPEFHLRRGIAWYYLGENRLARRDFEAAEAMFDGRGLFWSGVTYAKEGDFQEAVRLYTAALRLAPDFKPAYNNRGLAFMQLGKYERAARDFAELVRRDPQDRVSLQRRDEALQRQKAAPAAASRYYP